VTGAAVRSGPGRSDRGRALVDALGLTNRGIQLETAAEGFIRRCRSDARVSGTLAREGLRVCDAYRGLADELAGLGLTSPTAAAIVAVFEHHMRLVRAALDLAYRPQTEELAVQRDRLVDLGASSERLLALRDRLADEAPPELLDPRLG
jgi:hypothetical protein